MNKTPFKRVSTLLLAALMLLPAATACGKDDADVGTDTTTAAPAVADTTAAPETESPYDENGYLKDSLPDDLEFGDYTFHILGWKTAQKDFFADEVTGDMVSDALYERNSVVEDRLKVKITAEFVDGDNSNQSNFVQHASTAVLAGDACEYDLIGAYSMCGGTMATQGLILDLHTLDYLDFSKPWWSASLIEMSEINDKLFFATGDLANSFIHNLYFLMVNKDMLRDLGLDDPRVMVKDNTWTTDAFFAMTKDAYQDVDGTPGSSSGDKFGYISYNQVHMDCFIAASGIRMADEDKDGVLHLTDEFIGEKTHQLVEKINTWLWDSGDCSYDTKNGYNNIKNGNALFSAVAGSTVSGLRDVDWEYGIVPYPKAEAAQSQYYTNLGFAYTNFCIPINAKDANMSAAVLECMNAEAHRSSAPVLFEQSLKSRYANDELDGEMYDIIKGNIYVDANRVFSSSFVWADSAVAIFRNALTGNSSSYMSNIAAKKDSINGILANISASFGS